MIKQASSRTKITPKADKVFAWIVMALLATGLISLYSASYVISYYQHGDSWHFIVRQLVFAVIGAVAMFSLANINYKMLFGLAEWFYGLAVILLCVVLAMPPLNGARRWIFLGPATFQPSEIAKFAIIVVFAKYITFNENRMKTFKFGVFKLLGFMCVVAGLMILEPHISGTVLIFSIGALMMFVGGTSLFWFALGGAFLVFVVLLAIFIPGLVGYASSR